MLAIRTVLHATDFSEFSELAFRLACSLARDYGARLVVLHVAEPPLAFAGEGVLLLPPGPDPEELRGKLEQLHPRDPKVPVEHRLARGDAAAEILRAAGETKCDVIVLGTHGRTGLRRLLVGSVAEEVMRRAPCPVVTVKAPLPEVTSAKASRPETAASAAGATMG